MFEFAAVLALICAVILFFRNDPADRKGLAGFIGFWLLFGIAFGIIGGLFALFALVA